MAGKTRQDTKEPPLEVLLAACQDIGKVVDAGKDSFFGDEVAFAKRRGQMRGEIHVVVVVWMIGLSAVPLPLLEHALARRRPFDICHGGTDGSGGPEPGFMMW